VVKTVFLDRDGVINKPYIKNGKSFAPTKFNEFSIYPEAKESVRILHSLDFKVIVITNQPDIARGLILDSDISKMNSKMFNDLNIDDIFICPHSEEDNCNCRKPKPGMILEAKKKYKIDLNSSFLIGDRFTDIQAAKNTGCKSIFIDRNYNEKKPIFQEANVKNILSAVNFIKKIYSTKKYE
tara:strand:+ start:242 stop:787 length:546 start_codon:yes stop_codon:yes gene_type:complete